MGDRGFSKTNKCKMYEALIGISRWVEKGVVLEKIPSVGEVWVFSGTAYISQSKHGLQTTCRSHDKMLSSFWCRSADHIRP